MTELWLVYTDENHTIQRVAIRGDHFLIGRHSANDLFIPDSRLSREHLRIERSGEEFLASDCGSSNGTKINGFDLIEPRTLRNNDRLDLGGGVEISVEISAIHAEVQNSETQQPITGKSKKSGGTVARVSASETGGRSIPSAVFLLLPVIAFMLMAAFGTVLYFSRDTGFTITESRDSPTPYSETGDTSATATHTPDPKSSPSAQPGATSGNNSDAAPPSSPAPVSEFANVEINGSAFMRQIAQNEPRAFLTTEQSAVVGKKIKQMSSSSALAGNIESARKNSAKIKELAAAKNLPAQLLATAAVTELGNQRGDIIQTAERMSEVLGALNTQIGSERADDSLLMIAAYNQGMAGETMKLRNILQKLSAESTESSRTIRTIWFLKKNSKITEAEFEFALRFLATGSIMQNPKTFNVNAEALVF